MSQTEHAQTCLARYRQSRGTRSWRRPSSFLELVWRCSLRSVWGGCGALRVGRTLVAPSRSLSCAPGCSKRAAVLDARLDIYSVNFGEASRHLETARSALRAADAGLMASAGRRMRNPEDRVDSIDEAQRMAGRLNQDAELSSRRRGEDNQRCARAPCETLTRVGNRRVVERPCTGGRRTVHRETDDCDDGGDDFGAHAADGG